MSGATFTGQAAKSSLQPDVNRPTVVAGAEGGAAGIKDYALGRQAIVPGRAFRIAVDAGHILASGTGYYRNPDFLFPFISSPAKPVHGYIKALCDLEKSA